MTKIPKKYRPVATPGVPSLFDLISADKSGDSISEVVLRARLAREKLLLATRAAQK